MVYENILVEIWGCVGLVMLNCLKVLNVLNDVLMDELGVVLKVFDVDDDIGVIVVIGSEKVFVVGVDIGMMVIYFYMDVYWGDYIMCNWEMVCEICKLIIVVVLGFVLGGGCELVMMCDIIFVVDMVKFG